MPLMDVEGPVEAMSVVTRGRQTTVHLRGGSLLHDQPGGGARARRGLARRTARYRLFFKTVRRIARLPERPSEDLPNPQPCRGCSPCAMQHGPFGFLANPCVYTHLPTPEGRILPRNGWTGV